MPGVFWLTGLAAALLVEVPLSGSQELSEALLAAQITNLEAYPSGRLHATFRRKDDRSHEVIEAEVEMIWNGDDRYWEYGYQTYANGKAGIGKKTVRRIEASGLRAMFLGDEDRLILLKGGRASSIPDYLLLRPSECWYVAEGRGRSWQEMLDPQFGGTEFVKSVRVEPVDAERVLFIRDYVFGNQLQIWCSLAQGANVVEYAGSPATNFPLEVAETDNPASKGEYTWKPDASGGFQLVAMRHLKFVPGNERSPFFEETLTIHEFDPAYVIARDQFSLARLNVPPGAQVYEYAAQGSPRRYYFGGRPPEATDVLDQLINKSRDSGFSDQKRESADN